MEWMCAFLLSFFWASMIIDLLPRNYEGKQEAMAVKEAEKHGEDPEAARQRVRGSYDASAAGDHYNGSNQGAYGNVDPYGTVNTQPSTMAPSLAQQPLGEAQHAPARHY